jgi:hypothetical protein
MKKLLIYAMVLLVSIVAESAHASLSFDPSNTFSGTAPAGSITADFTDVAGGVQLVITSNLAAGENLDPGKALYFNVNPSKDSILQNLSFTLTGNTNFNQQATVMTGADSFKADGDGYYDINFTFNTSTKAFTTGESQTYKITTSSGTISASDFVNYLSSTGGGNGNWLAAVHVQNTPSGGSGSAWVGATVTPVPIPAAAWFFGPGLLGLMGIRKRMQQA